MKKIVLSLVAFVLPGSLACQNAYTDLKSKIDRYTVAVVYFSDGPASKSDIALLKNVAHANKYRKLNIGIVPVNLQSPAYAPLRKTYNYNRPTIVLFIQGAPVVSQESDYITLLSPFDTQKVHVFFDNYLGYLVPKKYEKRCSLEEIDCAYDAERAEYKEWQRLNAYDSYVRSLGWEKSPWGWPSGVPYWYGYDPFLLGPGNRFITVDGVTIA